MFLVPASILLIPTAESYVDFLPVIFLFFLVGGGFKEPLEDMMTMVISTSNITEGIHRMDHILYQEEISEERSGNPTTYDVTFEQVTFSYTEGSNAVENVSFHLPQGSITGLVGPSGGGKSTVAQLLLRFYEVQSGSIKIGGVDIREIPPSRLTNMVSYVFQDSFLFHDTVENNIRMGDMKSSKEAVIQAAFAVLAKNKTVLITAHRLKTVEKASQLLVMNQGKLMGVGTHERLLEECSIYQDMVAANERRDKWMIGKGRSVG